MGVPPLSSPTELLVHLVWDEELAALRKENAALRHEIEHLRALYGQEVNFNLRLADILDSHKIPWRG